MICMRVFIAGQWTELIKTESLPSSRIVRLLIREPFDGFRKIVEDEFDYVYIVDLRSDVRANPKIAGTTHNVFGIQTGVAIMFLVNFFVIITEKVERKEK